MEVPDPAANNAAEAGGSVLVPVDFSPASEAALVFAAEVAGRFSVPLLVLHVVHDPADAPGYYRLDNHETQLLKIEDVARGMLETFLAKVAGEHPESTALQAAESRLVAGLPVSRILEVVEQTRPRLVVMGNSGRTGISHLLIGSKAEQTVRLCPVPVTIVKAPIVESAEDAT